MMAARMQIVPYGPFRVSSVLWQPRPGAWAFTVICKATFELTPGESPLILIPNNAPESASQTAGDQLQLLEQAMDHAPLKRSPEVIVVGHAHAPEGAPMTSLVARLAVGDVDKVVQVFGDRYFTMEGALAGPARFTKMPLLWERAAGGPGTSNPVGVRMGADALVDGWGRIGLPNFQPAAQSIAMRKDVVPPVGFGPIAPNWPGRIARLHRHAARWDPGRWNERPLPEDVDFAYFNAAPPDQVLKELTGNERIALENLHPRFARLATYLRVVMPRATATVEGGASRDVHLRCDTLVIDADRGTATLVWRGNVPLDHPERAGIVLVSDGGNSGRAGVETVRPTAPLRPVMPFREAAPEGAPSGAMTPPDVNLRGEDAMSRALPDDDGTGTLVGSLIGMVTGLVLPFVERPELADNAQILPPTPVWPARPAEQVWEVRPAEPGWEEWHELPVVSRATVEPPSMLGSLATPARALPKEPNEKERESRSEVEVGKASEDASAVEELLPLDVYPIERCARIAAHIARRPEEKGAILEALGLSPERWTTLHELWLGRIRYETVRSRKKLLSDYDSAYVSALEAQCGAIALDDYVRLAEAAERSSVSEVLSECGLPESAWPHIHRVWIERMVKDIGVGKQVRTAIDMLRVTG